MKVQLILFFLVTSLTGFSQSDSLKQTETMFVGQSNPSHASNLYNGLEHLPYAASIEGYAYLVSDWSEGWVIYEGVEYSKVQLKYDLVKEELVVRQPNGLQVVLFSPRVKAFYFQGYLFENLPKPETKNHPDAGYYEVLQSGTIQLYAKRKKLLNETVTSTGIVKKFTGSTSYYAFKGGNAYQIRNENSLLDLMPEKKNDAKNYLKQHSISYKSNPEQTLSTIAQFYNQPAH